MILSESLYAGQRMVRRRAARQLPSDWRRKRGAQSSTWAHLAGGARLWMRSFRQFCGLNSPVKRPLPSVKARIIGLMDELRLVPLIERGHLRVLLRSWRTQFSRSRRLQRVDLADPACGRLLP